MEEIIKKLEKFIENRNWKKYHKPKNLAISIAIEAAELMEHFQWNEYSFEEIKMDEKRKEEIAEEVADVIIYCLLFFYYLGVDAKSVVMNKIKKNEKKYPNHGKKQNIYKKEGNS